MGFVAVKPSCFIESLFLKSRPIRFSIHLGEINFGILKTVLILETVFKAITLRNWRLIVEQHFVTILLRDMDIQLSNYNGNDFT